MTAHRLPVLSRGTLDRHTAERADPAYLDAAWERGLVLPMSADGRAAVRMGGLSLGATDGPRPDHALYLGAEDDAHYFAVVGDVTGRTANLREVGAELDDRDAGMFAHAVGLVAWHATHTHCPRCGAVTVVTHGGSQRECPVDGSHHFPRTDPAVIMLVTDPEGTRALLGRQPSWPPGRFSCLAGFVEPGESAEQAVVREVLEETGVRCWDAVPVSSQPWPFPASLMLGFRAVADPAAPMAPTDGELEDARWFSRAEITAGTPLLPPPVSIAHALITGWADR